MTSTPYGFREALDLAWVGLQTAGSCEDSGGHMQCHPEISKAGGDTEARVLWHIGCACPWLELYVLKAVMQRITHCPFLRTAKHVSYRQPVELTTQT